MSEFMRSTQATNSPRSVGRFGSRTRWMWTPADDLLRRRLLAAAGEHVDLGAALRRGPRRACARGARGRPRSAAGTPRRGSGRGSRFEGCQGSSRGRGSGPAPGCASAGRGGSAAESMASSRAAAWPVTRCVRVVARLAAAVEERPVARLHREQLARGALGGRRLEARRRAPRSSRSSSRRAAQARSATAGESQVRRSLPSPQLERAQRPRLGLVALAAPAPRVDQLDPVLAARARSTSASQTGPSHHQWPSSSVSIAKTISPGRPRSAREALEARGDRGDELAPPARAPAPPPPRGRRRRRRSPRAARRAATCGGSRRRRGRRDSRRATRATRPPPSRS